MNLAGSTAVGWFLLPQPQSYYLTTDASGTQQFQFERVTSDCLGAADPTVDFSLYDGIIFAMSGEIGAGGFGGTSTYLLEGYAKSYGAVWLYYTDWQDALRSVDMSMPTLQAIETTARLVSEQA